jgi:hypothetical protein
MKVETAFNFKNEKLRQMADFVMKNPRKYTYGELAQMFGLTYDETTSGIRRAKQRYNLEIRTEQGVRKTGRLPRSERKEEYIPKPPNTKNVLVIGDLHEPFTLDGYREFCYQVYKDYAITHVVFIGDIIDNHFSSFHTSDPDGLSGGEELEIATENIAKWYELFPKADVILGNHDLIVMRKCFEGGVPRRWIMSLQDMLGTPGWNFTERVVYDDIQYIHGLGGKARSVCRKDLMSTVQGHHHTDAYTEWVVGQNFKIFGMQVGCGVDRKSYAMAYAKNWPKQVIGVGVILNHGKQPLNILMNL